MQQSSSHNLTQHSLSSADSSSPIDQDLPHERKIKRKKPSTSPLVINVIDCKYPVVKQVAKDLRFKISREPNVEWDLTWTDNIVAPETLTKMRPHQKINHFPGMFNLSRKNYLARNIIKMQKEFANQYHFHPKTWTLPAQYNDLKQYLENQSSPIVIAKPEAGCQGRGIFLAKNIEQFQFGEHYVVQKYVRKPLLIQGLKFDLRVYVLVAGCDPLRVYVYREGLARFATEPYCSPKRENLGNLFMHLTNYAINKSNAKFEYNQSSDRMDVGHKRSLTSILNKLGEMGHNSQKIWNQICEIITKTLISVQPILAHNYRSCQPDNIQNNMCFEVLGFDVMLDSNLHPIILEVNYTPSFTTDTPLDLQIKEYLIRDTLVLLNLSNKAKNDALSSKKKEMMERTLTGKKIWHSKAERQNLLMKINAKRDAWEISHLGNYQRIYPVPNTQQDLAEKYAKFLVYSQACYLNVTGGNIKRNNKVSLPTTVPNDIVDNTKAHQKFTNTDQLERIYMKKQKPMIFQRKMKSNDSQLRSDKDFQKQETTQGRLQTDNERGKQQVRGKPYDSVQKISHGKLDASRAFTGEKGSPKEGGKRGSSVMQGRNVLSRIYNIAFREMKPSR